MDRYVIEYIRDELTKNGLKFDYYANNFFFNVTDVEGIVQTLSASTMKAGLRMSNKSYAKTYWVSGYSLKDFIRLCKNPELRKSIYIECRDSLAEGGNS